MTDTMVEYPEHNELDYEIEIVWEEPIGNLDYVRESRIIQKTNSRRPPRCPVPNGRRIGYSILSKSARPVLGGFIRRVFWLKDYDRDGSSPDETYKTGWPAEGVDPKTIKPGMRGQKQIT